MEDQQPQATPNDPIALASIGCGVGGVVVYCCGSFMCVGWLAFPVWLIGLVLGVVSAMKAENTSKTMAILGIVLNVLPGILFGVLMAFGVGLSLLSAATQN